ncbi:A/G-specific adenine glycosylase [Marivirga tractuosa]|uniref:Adenine DNA glycosylase n=1 Tax=Marivirga tractuosa (strain ATCC 23168 / DSM 4126 / NBRC 15989 / NCIMB 1408 / VKM B-1430 / H-43) TaxID=643867 RepID=E4TPK5_MARTH|nr:A/G-specific adenine glycosylase [Marivirga tractuosa]ADR22569.1 A/G-specific adenine glycosylase [Marivirga tractuosa DSM 4126]BDD16760.1 A/G-specific adenine glycosylase [Marivirga tractuosa]
MNQSFSNLLINWYNQHQRDLPWRDTSDPYRIWLSEIILQQTRVDQGLPYYNKFINQYPSVHELAKAPEDEVMRLWQGLGYYSRARNLHECAKSIVNQYDGEFPDTYEELLKLKGIGKYTAAAIASFAFDRAVPVVDGNVFRVLARYLDISDDISQPKTFKTFFNVAKQLIPENQAASFNQALMELGATICTPRKFKCENCPLSLDCQARIHHKQSELPVKKKKIKIRHRFLYYLIWKEGDKLAMKKRGPNDIWQGLFDFDLIETNHPLTIEEIYEKVNKQYSNVELVEISEPVKHILSHQRLQAVFVELQSKNENVLSDHSLKYFTKQEVEELPKPRLIENYLTSKDF